MPNRLFVTQYADFECRILSAENRLTLMYKFTTHVVFCETDRRLNERDIIWGCELNPATEKDLIYNSVSNAHATM